MNYIGTGESLAYKKGVRYTKVYPSSAKALVAMGYLVEEQKEALQTAKEVEEVETLLKEEKIEENAENDLNLTDNGHTLVESDGSEIEATDFSESKEVDKGTKRRGRRDS